MRKGWDPTKKRHCPDCGRELPERTPLLVRVPFEGWEQWPLDGNFSKEGQETQKE